LGSLLTKTDGQAALGEIPRRKDAEPRLEKQSGHFAPYIDDEDAIMPMAESGDITAGGCTFRQAIDDPHISSSTPLAASVHGWWRRIGGTCPSLANVDVYLQAYWCDGWGCRWVTVASASRDVRAGGGAGNRVTARRTCKSTKSVGWRGAVDVDLIGIDDPPGYTYSVIKNLGCEAS
jgi:hypothetical protein